MSIKESIKYGAVELKSFYNRNLLLALLISVGFHGVLIASYIILVSIGNASDKNKSAPIAKMKLSNLAPPPEAQNTPPPPPPVLPPNVNTNATGNGGVASTAGNIQAVPDALVDPNVAAFRSTELGAATSKAGDGTGFSIPDDPSKLNAGPQVNIEDKDPKSFTKEDPPKKEDEFLDNVDEEPTCDLGDLQANIKYPDIARRNNVEGKVVVMAFVDDHGKVARTEIVDSENKLLNDAAEKAVARTVFKPGIQNNKPVACKVTVPVNFKLTN